jgi:hypothetical protein
VFADLADAKPILTLDDGQPLPRATDGSVKSHGPDGSARLAPRALLLTALARAHFCDLFIHGTGGGVYDQVMEAWWQQWVGTPLAPRVTVSADVFLPFDAPVADRDQYNRAVWNLHHLPHNLDRALNNPPLLRDNQPVDDPSAPSDGRPLDPSSLPLSDQALIARKRQLLAAMDDDRDRPRRAAAFKEIHHINRVLGEAHPELLQRARADLERGRAGLANRHVAHRRDWCFALYPQRQLQDLDRAIADVFDPSLEGSSRGASPLDSSVED